MALQTEWFRIGKSGPTVDGRVIKPEWLVDAANNYDPDNKFAARIWPDHNRYVNYGRVSGVRLEDNPEGGKDLYARLEPNAFYQSDVRYGQKVHFSMEITPNFAKTGKAYLTGLGATDDPASLGTGEAKFTKYADQAGVFRADFVDGESKQFEDPEQPTLLAQIKALFKNTPPEDADMADKKALEELKTELVDIKAMFAKLTGDKQDDKKDDKADLSAEAFNKLISRLDALEAKFSQDDAGKEGDKTGDELSALAEKFAALSKKLDDALKEQPGTDGGEHFGNEDDLDSYL